MAEFLAAWWWINRWRKSTAYTDMTLAEQGAYRNLLDELWLRNGALPKDERVLAKISGDALSWQSVRSAVMARFYEAADGYRNATHDEIAAISRERKEQFSRLGTLGGKARAAKAHRDGSGRFQPSAAGITAGRAPGPDTSRGTRPPSPSPSPDQTPEPSPTDTEASPPARVARKRASPRTKGDPRINSLKTAWTAMYATAAGEEPKLNHGLFGKQAKELLRTHDEPEIVRRANDFLGSERGRMQGYRFEAFYKDFALYSGHTPGLLARPETIAAVRAFKEATRNGKGK